MRSWLSRIHEITGFSIDLQEKILWTVAALLLVFVLRFLTRHLLERHVSDNQRYRQLRRMVNYLAGIIAAVVLWRVWLGEMGSLGTFLGLLSAGIAIAMQDVIANIAGRAYILWLRPFQLGDRIEVDGTVGDVIDMGLFHFTLLEVGKWVDADQSTGRVVTVPNGKVLKNSVFNYTTAFDYIWNELPVTVTFESDWKSAKEIITAIGAETSSDSVERARSQLKQSARKYSINYERLDPAVFTKVADSGVVLTLRYLTQVRRRRLTEQNIWEKILMEFGKRENIDFAYPTRRFYDNKTEGKPETGGPSRRAEVGSAPKDTTPTGEPGEPMPH